MVSSLMSLAAHTCEPLGLVRMIAWSDFRIEGPMITTARSRQLRMGILDYGKISGFGNCVTIVVRRPKLRGTAVTCPRLAFAARSRSSARKLARHQVHGHACQL